LGREADGVLATLMGVAADRGHPDESSRRTRSDDGAFWRVIMDQLVQIFGSLLVLVAFLAAQRGALSAQSRSYLLLNLAGSTILTVLAAHERQYGFLLLEFCWALASAWGLAQMLRARHPRAT
jgi:hypothetical protein